MTLVTINKPEHVKSTVAVADELGILPDDAAGLLLLDYDHSVNKSKMSTMKLDLSTEVIEIASRIAVKLKIDVNTVYVYLLIKSLENAEDMKFNENLLKLKNKAKKNKVKLTKPTSKNKKKK